MLRAKMSVVDLAQHSTASISVPSQSRKGLNPPLANRVYPQEIHTNEVLNNMKRKGEEKGSNSSKVSK